MLGDRVRGSLPPPHVRAWYCYAFAAEVFAACALAIFLPITLEHIARDVGFLAPDLTIPCAGGAEEGGAVCKAEVLGIWLDTASFSMYVKSLAVAVQALCIISIGPLADHAYWRKRILGSCALLGSLSGILFLPLPSSPLLAALLTVLGNAAYATSIVCANAFLPGLARKDAEVIAAGKAVEADGQEEGEEVSGEVAAALPVSAGPGGPGAEETSLDEGRQLLPQGLMPVVTAISAQDLARPSVDEADGPTATGRATEDGTAATRLSTLLSLTTSRLSSTGTAIGFLSGVSVLALLIIPVTIMHGSTASLRLAISLSALWWGVFSVPAWLGLPGGERERTTVEKGRSWLGQAWRRVGRMVTPGEMRRLPNLFTFLLAWIFLSDGFHTTTYTAILYASSTLHMSPPKVILIGILVQLAAVVSSILAPRMQRRLGYSNLKLLLALVLAGEVIPVYACSGLILPFGGLRTESEMYVAATWFGLLYGPFNSYSRAVYAELIPPGHESTFFSLFSLTDKSASFFGPFVVGLISDLTGNIRLGFVFLLVMLALPFPVLLRVSVERGRKEAGAWAEQREEAEAERLLGH